MNKDTSVIHEEEKNMVKLYNGDYWLSPNFGWAEEKRGGDDWLLEWQNIGYITCLRLIYTRKVLHLDWTENIPPPPQKKNNKSGFLFVMVTKCTHCWVEFKSSWFPEPHVTILDTSPGAWFFKWCHNEWTHLSLPEGICQWTWHSSPVRVEMKYYAQVSLCRIYCRTWTNIKNLKLAPILLRRRVK